MYLKKIIIFIIFTSIFLSQEAGILSNKNKNSLTFISTIFNTFNEANDIKNSTYKAIKVDFKIKGPYEFWYSFLDDNNSNIINQIGFAYVLKARKWGLTLFINKNITDNSDQALSTSYYMGANQFGWIYNLKGNNPIYVKYTNVYNNADINNILENNKQDYISLGNYIRINKFILSYGITFNAKDFLILDLNDGIIELSFGYKFI